MPDSRRILVDRKEDFTHDFRKGQSSMGSGDDAFVNHIGRVVGKERHGGDNGIPKQEVDIQSEMPHPEFSRFYFANGSVKEP